MVVVHPHHVLTPRHRRHRVGELVVRLAVASPLLLLRRLVRVRVRVGVRVRVRARVRVKVRVRVRGRVRVR